MFHFSIRSTFRNQNQWSWFPLGEHSTDPTVSGSHFRVLASRLKSFRCDLEARHLLANLGIEEIEDLASAVELQWKLIQWQVIRNGRRGNCKRLAWVSKRDTWTRAIFVARRRKLDEEFSSGVLDETINRRWLLPAARSFWPGPETWHRTPVSPLFLFFSFSTFARPRTILFHAKQTLGILQIDCSMLTNDSRRRLHDFEAVFRSFEWLFDFSRNLCSICFKLKWKSVFLCISVMQT